MTDTIRVPDDTSVMEYILEVAPRIVCGLGYADEIFSPEYRSVPIFTFKADDTAGKLSTGVLISELVGEEDGPHSLG